MQRVLHILPHRGGGGEVYVSMLGADDRYAHERFYLSAGRTPPAAMASLPLRLPALARRVRTADLVHAHGDVATIIASPLLPRAPTVITTHGLHLLRRSKGVVKAGARVGLRRAIAGTQVVIATSQSEADELAELVTASDRRKLQVILNGVRLGVPISDADRQRVRAALGIEPGTILGLFAGELEPRKEPLLAAAAASRARRHGLPFVLAFAGDGPLAERLRAQDGDAVLALGFRDDVDRLMSAADLFVHPASREGLSLSVLEAMSHGLAVIAADAPGNVEAIAETGLLFPSGDEAALVAGIARLCRDDALRLRLAQAARQRGADKFGATRFVVETMSAYEQALA